MNTATENRAWVRATLARRQPAFAGSLELALTGVMTMTGRKPELMIEPERGFAYDSDGEYAVYAYDVFPAGSVLAGQERRRFTAGGFASEAAAKAAYPEAVVAGGSGYREIAIPHTPPEWFDPANAGEHWDDEDY